MGSFYRLYYHMILRKHILCLLLARYCVARCGVAIFDIISGRASIGMETDVCLNFKGPYLVIHIVNHENLERFLLCRGRSLQSVVLLSRSSVETSSRPIRQHLGEAHVFFYRL